MPETSVILQELLTALSGARQGTTLVLDQATLGPTSAASLVDLFTTELQITSFTLADVQLPASVTGTGFTVSGHDPNVTLDLTFTDSTGEVAIEALFSAPGIAALRQEFPHLPTGFFAPITVAGGTATVSVPGLAGPLTFPSPRYGVAGTVTPSSGLMTTSIAAQVDGQSSSPVASPGLQVQVQADIQGYQVAPLASSWSFDELGALLPGLGILAAIPLISTENLGLKSFGLYLYGAAPDMSSIILDVADITDPAKALWSALGGKIQLTDVIVTLNLTYSSTNALTLTGTGSVQGNFLLDTVVLSVEIPSPATGIWSLTAYPNLSLPVLDNIGWLLGYDSQQFNSLLPAQLGTIGGFQLSYLRIAVNASTFSLAEFTFAVISSQPWTLIPGVLELGSLQIRLTIDGTASVTGMVLGVFGLPEGADILVSVSRSTPQVPWQLAAVSAAIALPSLGQLAQLAQGQDLATLVKTGGLDQLHFVMTNMNFGMTLAPAKLTRLGLTLQLANADDPLMPVVDWDIIPGALTLTQFSFGFQINWGATTAISAFGAFVLNGLEFDVLFASRGTTTGLIAQYTNLEPSGPPPAIAPPASSQPSDPAPSAPAASGTVTLKDLIASVAPTLANVVPDGLTITLADAALAYLDSGGTAKFLFSMDLAAGIAATGLPLPPDMLTGNATLSLLVVSAALSAQEVAFVNSMSATPVLPAAGDGVPAGFAFTGELTDFTIGQLLADLAATYGIGQVPAPIASLVLSEVSVSYQSGTGRFAFDLEAGFTVESAPVAVAVTITVMPSAQTPAAGAVVQGSKGYAALFTGQVKFAGLQFDLVFDATGTGTDVLVADFVGSGTPVELQALVAGVSQQVAQVIPAGISLDLKEAKFVFLKQTASVWAFGVRLGASVNLNELPIVGSKLPPDQTLAIQNLQILYSSAAMTSAQTGIINPLLPSGVAKLPDTVGQGIEFNADVQLGSVTQHLQAGVTPPALPAGFAAGTALPASSTDPVKWLDVNKQFGIFSFQRVGAGYQDNVLLFALDASVSVGPLAFSMQALSVGSPLSEFSPVFSLQGLALTFDRPPLSIGGAFLKVRETVGSQSFDSYYGELIVQAATFSLKALGGWAPDAQPASFFIYLAINVPLGGPPFLFVTGLAGGFGINSQLTLPTIDQVSSYPLLPGNAPPEQGSPAETIKAVIPALQRTFSPLAGQYWVAAGIAFTSFEMIQAQAVVSVSFGVDLQIGVVGVCSMTFPTGDPFPIAYVEIDVLASFTPSTGLLAVQGQLSPASNLFGGFVKLTGGFAFYAWFAGPSQGDFVVTLGGYHPAFSKPDNYPVVPRLGLALSLGPLKVIGQSYFALTPSMFMAGIRMTATFEAGPVKAWFDAGVDFLICWAPFHYEAHAWVTIGCSVDLGLFTLSVQIGADLQIWGPAFGGQATIDLDIVSFTIAFGAPRAAPPPVGWNTFATNFLPPPEPPPAATPAAGHAATPAAGHAGRLAPRAMTVRAATPATPAAAQPAVADGSVPGILKATVTAGLTGQPPGLDWILDPDQFRILTASTIPANHAIWVTSDTGTAELPNVVADYQQAGPPSPPAPQTPAPAQAHAQAIVPPPAQMLLQLDYGTVTYSSSQVWAPDLNIAPMGETAIAAYHTVTLLKSDEDGHFTGYVTSITAAPQLGASGTALWGPGGQATDPNADRLIPATLTGLAISPVPRHPDKVSDVALLSLIYGQGNSTGFSYQDPVVDQEYTVTSETTGDGSASTFTITVSGAHTASLTNEQFTLTALTDPWVTTQRTATLDQLSQLGFATIPGNAAHLTVMAETALTDRPTAARIGTETWA